MSVKVPACASLGDYLKAHIDAGCTSFLVTAESHEDESVLMSISPMADPKSRKMVYAVATSAQNDRVVNLERIKRLVKAECI